MYTLFLNYGVDKLLTRSKDSILMSYAKLSIDGIAIFYKSLKFVQIISVAKNAKPETTITHILLSTYAGNSSNVFFCYRFFQTENLNRLMDSFFWLAFIFTFFH